MERNILDLELSVIYRNKEEDEILTWNGKMKEILGAEKGVYAIIRHWISGKRENITDALQD